MRKELINNQKKILDVYNNQKVIIQQKINNLKSTNITTNKNTKSYDYKKDLETIFNNLRLLSDEIYEITNSIAYKDSINKIYYLYEEDSFIKEYNENKNNENKNNKNKILKTNISQYFANKLNNQTKNKSHYFIKDLLNIYKKNENSNKNDEIKLFFDNLQKMDYDLTYIANTYIDLLDKEGNVKLNSNNITNINSISKKINDQIDAIKTNVNNQGSNSNFNKNNSAKYIDILPYTDIIYMYFVQILLIIYKYPEFTQ